nr:putative chemosensory protein 6 [Corcyra cephalonica]
MKTIIALCIVIAAVVSRPQDLYNSQFDNFNAEEVAGNVRLLKNYGKCFLDQGPCTAEGSDFKRVIPEALRTNCGRCTPKQRVLIRTIVQAFKTKLPDIWGGLVEKHDPEGIYKADFDRFLNSRD